MLEHHLHLAQEENQKQKHDISILISMIKNSQDSDSWNVS